MKLIKIIQILCCITSITCAHQFVENYEELVQKLEAESCKAIDTIFSQAREAIEAGQNIITVEWLNHKRIEEIEHALSNVRIELGFDRNAEKMFSEKLYYYLQSKIGEEVDKIFEYKNLTVDQVDQFFLFSKLVCKLQCPIDRHGQIIDCSRMMRAIKDENFPCRENLKIQKKVERQAKKEERRDLCRAILLGAVPRQ